MSLWVNEVWAYLCRCWQVTWCSGPETEKVMVIREKAWPHGSSLHQQRRLYLSHDPDGRLSRRLCDAVLHQIEHVLVVQQPDQVERAETRRAAKGQISDDHRAAREKHSWRFALKGFLHFQNKVFGWKERKVLEENMPGFSPFSGL